MVFFIIIIQEKMDKLFIIIPAYNEEENIETIIKTWYPIVEKIQNNSRLVIIDDGSKDNTFKIMKECKEKYTLLEPITKSNGGHGATVLFGYHYAIKQGADYIFQTDSDGQTLPEEFWQFWKLRKKYDMVIGYRNKREDGVSRILVTKTLKVVIRLIFGVSVTDANTPFRLMETKKLNEYLSIVPKDFNLSNVILSVIYIKRGSKVKYIPITFRPRQGGVNSINLSKIFGIGKKALVDFYMINKNI